MAVGINLKHTTTKAAGQRVFAVADWNADHQVTSNIDIGNYDIAGGIVNFTGDNGVSPGGDAEDVATFTSGDGADGIEILGSNLVTNGVFAADTDWEKLLWTIGGGTANVNTNTVNPNYVRQSIAISNGKKYKVTYDITALGGTANLPSIQATLGGTLGIKWTSTGSKTEYITAGGADTYISFTGGTSFIGGTVVASIDNVVVEEVTQEGDAGQGGDFIVNLGSAGTEDGDGAGSREGHFILNTVLEVPAITGLVDLSISGDLTVGGNVTAVDGTFSGDLECEHLGVGTGASATIAAYNAILGDAAHAGFLTGVLSIVQQNADAAGVATYRGVVNDISIDDDTNKHNEIVMFKGSASSVGDGGVTNIIIYDANCAFSVNADNLYLYKTQLNLKSRATNTYGYFLAKESIMADSTFYGIVLDSDDAGWGAIWRGNGQDCKDYYNGTNWIFNPAVVGTGSMFLGDETTNYTEIKNDGEINLHGTAKVLRHLRVGAASWKGGVSAPTEGFDNNFVYLAFDNVTDDDAFYTVIVPARWDGTTDIEFAADWYYTGVQDNGTVCWGLEYKAIKAGEVVTGVGTIIAKTSAGTHTTGQMVRTTFTSKLLAANLEAGDTLGLKIFRDVDGGHDAGDTLATDAKLLNTHLHFIQNKIGEAT